MPSKDSKYRIFQGKLLTKSFTELQRGIHLLMQKLNVVDVEKLSVPEMQELDVPKKRFLIDLKYASPPLDKDTIQKIKACFFYIELPNYPNATKHHQEKFEQLLDQWVNSDENEVYINKNHTFIDENILISYNQVAGPLYGAYTQENEKVTQM